MNLLLIRRDANRIPPKICFLQSVFSLSCLKDQAVWVISWPRIPCKRMPNTIILPPNTRA